MTKIVLGGGLSGLAATYYLSRLVPQQKIILLEQTDRLGGWIKSERINEEVIFETSARTLRPGGLTGINTLNLLEELHLHADIKPIHQHSPAAQNRFIYSKGELHALPRTAVGFLTTQKPFTKPLVLQILKDLTAKRKIVHDEPIYEFVQRRFGNEVADYLIDPLICGICAGNSKEISVNFLMKTLFNYEQTHGSVLKGALHDLLFGVKAKIPSEGLLSSQCKAEKWSVYTFHEGMQTLPKALENALRRTDNVDIHLNSMCQEVQFNDEGVKVILNNGQQYDSDHIISSIPAKNFGQLVQNQHPKMAEKLKNIKTVTVGVVNLLYKGNLIPKPGFGFLVPPKENLPILGVIYDSCAQGYKDKTVLTVMMGGYWFNELFGAQASEENLLEIAKCNVKTILKIPQEPVQFKVSILKNCIPQYIVGHEQNVQQIMDYIQLEKMSLSLCGASYSGVGVNDVILSAKKVLYLHFYYI